MTFIDIPTADGVAEAWLSRPAEGAADGAPAVLLFMDAFGIRPRIQEMADRIASWGYTVLMPNVFYREGSVAELAPTGNLREPEGRAAAFALAGPRIPTLTCERIAADTERYLAVLADETGDREVAVMGYCMGVRLSLHAAAAHPERVRGVAGFHGGGLVTEGADSPHTAFADLRGPVLLRHADADHSMPEEAMDVITAAAAEHGVELSQEVYPGAPHGYSMADTSSYHEVAAEWHFEELQALLARLSDPSTQEN